MKTNKLKIKINYENVKNDFDIYVVSKKEKLYKTNVLDTLNLNYRAISVQYLKGAKALVLFDKKEDIKAYLDEIKRNYEDVYITRVDIENSQDRQEYFAKDDIYLSQLLFNSLKYKKKIHSYNNITGRLYYMRDKWIKDKFFKSVEIRLSKDNILNINVRTFTKFKNDEKISKKPMIYVFDKKTGQFRRKLKTDKNYDYIYIQKGNPKNKSEVKFLNIENIDEFEKSKLGIMCEFLEEVNTKLGKYINVEMSEKNQVEKAKADKTLENIDYQKVFNKFGLNIVDEVKNKESKILLENIEKYLSLRDIRFKISENLLKEQLNLRIIRNEKFYNEQKEEDIHNTDLDGYIIQHLTSDDFKFKTNKKGISASFENVLLELMIKNDIANKKISIYNWKNINQDINFVSRIQNPKFDKEKEKDEDNKYIYYLLKVKKNSKLQFESFCKKDSLKLKEEYRKIIDTYENYDREKLRSKYEIYKMQYLVYKDIDYIYAIFQTFEFTVPNIYNIRKELEDTDPLNKFGIEEVIQCCKEFELKYPKYEKIIKEFMEKILKDKNIQKDKINAIVKENVDYEIDGTCFAKDIKTIQKTVKGFGDNAKKLFDNFLRDSLDKWIGSRIRRTEEQDKFSFFESFKDIQYIDDKEGLYYFVGTNQPLKLNFRTANIIRFITRANKFERFDIDREFLKEILKLMAVEFVRYGQYTVYPFPIKYLREYINIKNPKKNKYEKYKQISFDDYLNN